MRTKSFEPSTVEFVIVAEVALEAGVATWVQVEPFALVSRLSPVTGRLLAPIVGATQVTAMVAFALFVAVSDVGASGVVTGVALTDVDADPQPLLL